MAEEVKIDPPVADAPNGEKAPETFLEKVGDEAKVVEQDVEKFVEKVEEKVEGIFGVKKTASVHGTQDAAVAGLQTDADPGYVHPAQLPKT